MASPVLVHPVVFVAVPSPIAAGGSALLAAVAVVVVTDVPFSPSSVSPPLVSSALPAPQPVPVSRTVMSLSTLYNTICNLC